MSMNTVQNSKFNFSKKNQTALCHNPTNFKIRIKCSCSCSCLEAAVTERSEVADAD